MAEGRGKGRGMGQEFDRGSRPGASEGWNVAILGATGMVGRVMLQCLAASDIDVSDLRLLSSPRSAGTEMSFRGESLTVEAVTESSFAEIDLALFSAGASASGIWGPRAVEAGAWVVDNSSKFRMDATVPLIVPEVNSGSIPATPTIIANPNCSTIQMVVALAPIHRAFGLERVHVATYQAASGSGVRAVKQLEDETSAEGGILADGSAPATDSASKAVSERCYPHRLLGNVIPQCDVFLDDGYTREEQKMIEETRKILGDDSIWVHPTCVRVPVHTCHSEAVYLETREDASLEDIRELLENAPGVAWLDDPVRSRYPMPIDAVTTDPVWVGRLRKDRSAPRGFHLWVVADNLRKGAAVNALQIADVLWQRRTVKS